MFLFLMVQTEMVILYSFKWKWSYCYCPKGNVFIPYGLKGNDCYYGSKGTGIIDMVQKEMVLLLWYYGSQKGNGNIFKE